MFRIYKERFENNESSTGPSYKMARSKVAQGVRGSIDKIKGDLSLPDQGSQDAEYMLYYLGVAPKLDFFDEIRQNFEGKSDRLKIRMSGAHGLEDWVPAAAARYLMDMSLGMKNGLIEFATISGDPLLVSLEQFQDIREMELFSVKFKHQYLTVNIGGETVRLACNHKVKKNVKKEFENKVRMHPDFQQLLSLVIDSDLNVSTKTLIKYFCYKYYNLDSPSFRISNRRLQVLDGLYSRVQSKRSNSAKIVPKVSRAVKKNKPPVRKKQSVKVSSRSSISKKSESVNSQPQNEFLFSDDFVESVTPEDMFKIQSKEENTKGKLTLREVVILTALKKKSPRYFNRLPRLLPKNFSYTTVHKRYNEESNLWERTNRRKEDMPDWLFLSHLLDNVDRITKESFYFKDIKTNKQVMFNFKDVEEATFNPNDKGVFFKCRNGQSYSFRIRRPFGKLARSVKVLRDKIKIPKDKKKQMLIYLKLFSAGGLPVGDSSLHFIKLLRGNTTNIPSLSRTNFKVADVMANGLSEGNVESFLSYKYFGAIKSFMEDNFDKPQWYDVLQGSIKVMWRNLELYKKSKSPLLNERTVTSRLRRLVRELKQQKGMIIEIGHKSCGPCKKISKFNSIDGKPFLFPIQFGDWPSKAVQRYLISEFNLPRISRYPVIIRIDENGRTQYEK